MTEILCIYHANCADGFGAAWAVGKALGPDVVFFAASYQEDPPGVAGAHVIIVDFSYKRDVLLRMSEDALSVLVLDHHKSAAEDLRGLNRAVNGGWAARIKNAESVKKLQDKAVPHAIFDMERSGAMITWDYFFSDKPVPLLIQHIQDRDLWKFEMEGSRRIAAALFSETFLFYKWDLYMRDELMVAELIKKGGALTQDATKKINDFIKVAAYRTVLDGYDVPILNAPYFFASEAGHILAEGEPFSITYFDTPKGRKFSLRSTDEGVDVSEIAASRGGGGHRNAAGFEAPLGSPLADRIRRVQP